MFDSVKSFCEACSPLTLWGTVLIFAAAIFFGLKNGFHNKPLGKSEDSGPGKWGWIAVAVLWIVVMLNYFDRQLLGVLNTEIRGDIRDGDVVMSQYAFGWLTSAFLIVYAVLSPVGGFLADRFSRKFIILCSLVVWSAVTWLTGIASSYWELFTYRALMGVSEAFYIPAALALITDYHRGKTRSMATGIHMSGIYVGQALAGYGATMSTDWALGWRLTFESFGFLGVAYALVVIIFLRDPEAAEETTAAVEEKKEEEKKEEPTAPAAEPAETFSFADVMRSLFSTRAMTILLILLAFAGFANWFLLTWYPVLLQETFELSSAEAGPAATVGLTIAKYAAVLGGAVIADMWYLRNKNARAYVPAICFLIAGPCVMLGMLMPLVLGLTVVVTLVASQGLAQGALDATLMPILRSHIDSRFAATGYGMLNLTSAGVGAITGFLGGLLNDWGVPFSLLLAAAGFLMLLCGGLLFMLPKHK